MLPNRDGYKNPSLDGTSRENPSPTPNRDGYGDPSSDTYNRGSAPAGPFTRRSELEGEIARLKGITPLTEEGNKLIAAREAELAALPPASAPPDNRHTEPNPQGVPGMKTFKFKLASKTADAPNSSTLVFAASGPQPASSPQPGPSPAARPTPPGWTPLKTGFTQSNVPDSIADGYSAGSEYSFSCGGE